MGQDRADELLRELLALWGDGPPRRSRSVDLPREASSDAPYFASQAVPQTAKLGEELGEQLVSEVLLGVRAGRQGIFVSDPERLRTAIFLRGYSLGEFARLAGLAPSTVSRVLAGQPVAPGSWRALITALARA